MTANREATLPHIVIDAMGGDHAPEAIVEGALIAARSRLARLTLVGDEARLRPMLGPTCGHDFGIEIVHASQVIGMDEAPAAALRAKRDASITVAMRLVKEGKADGVVAAGSTGAAMAAALMVLGRIPGIERPAIAVVLPTQQGPCVLLDVGANVDARPAYLAQFALMGSVYHKAVFKTTAPRVGLFNIGEEEGKGNEQAKEAYGLIKALPNLNFIGNVEGRDLPAGHADVVVCDGFVGNGLLKFAEGMALLLVDMLKQEIGRDLRGKLGAAMMAPNLRALKRRLDYAEYGGAPLLGVNGVCIIGHGSSKALGVYHTIRVARECIEGRAIATIQDALAASPAATPGAAVLE